MENQENITEINKLNSQKQEDIIENIEGNKDWKKINTEFTEKLQKKWENKGFSYEECQMGINRGLTPDDADFAEWLRDEKIKKIFGESSSLELLEKLIVKCSRELRQLRKEYQDYHQIQELTPQELNLQETYDSQIKEIIRDISVGRLVSIKNETKAFLNKWEEKNIQTPEEFNKYYKWILGIIKWGNRGALVTSGGLLVAGYQDMSNWTTLVSPFVEIIISRLEDELQEKKENWKEFKRDAEKLLNSYFELIIMIEPIQEFPLRKETKGRLKELNDAVCDFFKELDKDGNKKIDFFELEALYKREDKETKEKKQEFLTNLGNCWKNKMVTSLKKNKDDRKGKKKEKEEITKKQELEKIRDAVSGFAWDIHKHKYVDIKKIKKTVPILFEGTEGSQETTKWFDAFPELNPEKDSTFVLWLKNTKSKELENFADPRWVKERIENEELELSELRKEYQEENDQYESVIEINLTPSTSEDFRAQTEIPPK